MCVVSMVGDHYAQKWNKWNVPETWPNIGGAGQNPLNQGAGYIPTVSKAEFDALRKEVEEMKQLLIRAVEYDKRTNQPHCEMEEKVALLKKVAEMVGVDLKDIFNNNA